MATLRRFLNCIASWFLLLLHASAYYQPLGAIPLQIFTFFFLSSKQVNRGLQRRLVVPEHLENFPKIARVAEAKGENVPFERH